MMKTLSTLLLSLLLTFSLPLQAEQPSTPQDQTAAQAQQLIAELLNNVDWQLLLRIQQNLLENMDKLIPYTEEYLQCLEQEGGIAPGQYLDLQMLFDQAGKASDRCNVIIKSLVGQLDFDISQQEFEQGLSPEYREMLKKSL